MTCVSTGSTTTKMPRNWKPLFTKTFAEEMKPILITYKTNHE
jgi:hypothetical protein